MTRPSWLGRAVRNRHRHAIEKASRRWRGGRRGDSARRRRELLISTQVEACKYDKGDCCASTCVSTATTTCGESGYDCVDPEVLALWSGCGWIESNSNTDGEQSVGQVSSPSECIAKVLDECPGFEIANLPANGVGECFCQQGGSPVPDSSGYPCGNQPTT